MTGERLPPLLEVRDLRSRYGRTEVLDGVGFSVAAGEVVGLVGPNGSGKSSLLKCLGGLRATSGGSIAVAGRAIQAFSRNEFARTVAYVPQHSGPGMSLRVIDMVMLGRLPHRATSSDACNQRIALDMIQRLGLEPLALRHFSELSGGERQRVLIARALAQQGRLLLLDEPTSDLDLRHQLAAMATVRDVADRDGAGCVVAIHDLALAARFCDRLLMLRQGRVHGDGPWRAVLTPANIQALFGVDARIGSDGGLPYVIPISEGPINGID
ncbi:MAG: ABC transporter ATP-binding protein [Comamonadaceae bacterium]|nr:MAG: ABC transporter ATP-binding protein [Comamonadaceae bacterium]